MRRGTLADHPVPHVLRTAATERLDGQLDFDGGRPASVYLTAGAVSLVCWHDDVPDVGLHHIHDGAVLEAHEHRARHLSVTVLRDLLTRRDGWYHHFPFGDHPAVGLWGWDVDDLLARAAAGGRHVDEGVAGPPGLAGPSGPGGRPNLFGPPPSPEPLSVPDPAPQGASPSAPGGWRLVASVPATVDGQTWALLGAMVGVTSRDEVVARSGWPVEQVDAVLGRLASEGVLVRDGGADELLGGRVRSRHDRRAGRST